MSRTARIRMTVRRFLAKKTYQANAYRRQVIQSQIADLLIAEHQALLDEAESKCLLRSLGETPAIFERMRHVA